MLEKFKIHVDLNSVLKQETTKDKHLIIGQMNEKNQAHGAALMIKTDGSLIREGSFQNGIQQGYGRHIWD